MRLSSFIYHLFKTIEFTCKKKTKKTKNQTLYKTLNISWISINFFTIFSSFESVFGGIIFLIIFSNFFHLWFGYTSLCYHVYQPSKLISPGSLPLLKINFALIHPYFFKCIFELCTTFFSHWLEQLMTCTRFFLHKYH